MVKKKASSTFINFPAALKPRLRVFFSVDLAGSTSFKLSKQNSNTYVSEGNSWFEPIIRFYRDFDADLQASYNSIKAKFEEVTDSKLSSFFEFWKSIGDELLYTVEIKDEREATWFVYAWLNAIEVHGKRLRNDKKNPNILDLKSTAWLAGFPIFNREVVIDYAGNFAAYGSGLSQESLGGMPPETVQYMMLNYWYKKSGKRLGLSLDFLGTGIDTGFRLSSLATPGKLVLSIDLVRLLTKDGIDDEPQENISYHFGGKVSLKGVLGGQPYPVIWIEFVDGNGKPRLESNMSKVNEKTLCEYAGEFIKTHNQYIIEPFFYIQDYNRYFNKLPTWYLDGLKERKREYEEQITDAKNKAIGDLKIDDDGSISPANQLKMLEVEKILAKKEDN